MSKPNAQGENFWRWGLWEVSSHEDRAPMNRTSSLIKETPQSHLTPEEMLKTTIYEAGSKFSSDTASASNLMLDFQPPLW